MPPYLTEELGRIPGLIPPFVPDDRTSVFYIYRLRFDLDVLGLAVEPAIFRDRLGKALLAEGVDASLWHVTPVTSFPIFETKAGLAPGFPWTLSAGDREYRPEDYPVAKRLLETSICVGDGRHPLFVQPRSVMEGYVEAFAKVLADPGRLLRD